jgi:hypothetical protein
MDIIVALPRSDPSQQLPIAQSKHGWLLIPGLMRCSSDDPYSQWLSFDALFAKLSTQNLEPRATNPSTLTTLPVLSFAHKKRSKLSAGNRTTISRTNQKLCFAQLQGFKTSSALRLNLA